MKISLRSALDELESELDQLSGPVIESNPGRGLIDFGAIRIWMS